MTNYRISMASGILLAVLVASRISSAESFHCQGGLATPSRLKAAQTADNYLRWGTRDATNNFLPHTTLTFSFIESNENDDESGFGSGLSSNVNVTPIRNNVGNFPANARALIRNAFTAWSIVADITFIEVFEPGEQGQIRIGAHTFSNARVLGHGFFPPIDNVSGDGLVGDLHLNSQENWRDNVGQFFAVVLHEIGHTLGLGHLFTGNATDDPVMFPFVGTEALPFTKYDSAYVQKVYGPPIPKITTDSGANERLVTWKYPYNPFNPQTFDPTSIDPNDPENPRVALFDSTPVNCSDTTPECDVDPDSDENDVVITEVVTRDLASFQIQSFELITATFTDDGGDTPGNRLFDTTVEDGVFSVGEENEQIVVTAWEVVDDREPEDDVAYGISAMSAPFENDENFPSYSLPLLSSQRFLATETTRWRFRRSYLLSVDQRIEYRINNVTDDVVTALGFTEMGDDGPPVANLAYDAPPEATLPDHIVFQNGEFIINLGSLVDKEFSIDYIFSRGAAFDDEILFIDEIVLEDIIRAEGEFTTVVSDIPQTESLSEINHVPAGTYNLQIGAVYNEFSGLTSFSRTSRRVFEKKLTINPLTTTDGSPPLTGIISEPDAALTLTINGDTVTPTNNQDGTWALADNTLNELPEGVYDVQISADDGSSTFSDQTVDELTIAVPPAVIGRQITGDNNSIEIEFSEGVYGDALGQMAIDLSDFQINLNNGSGNVTIESITNQNGEALLGGESKIKLTLSFDGDFTGMETVDILLAQDIFDGLGNPVTSGANPIASVTPNGHVEFTFVFNPADNTKDPVTLIMGRDSEATTNNDDTLDVESPSPTPIMYVANTQSESGPERLQEDFRPIEGFTAWQLHFDPGTEGIAGQLVWTLSNINPDYSLFLQVLEDQSPAGAPIDLANTAISQIGLSGARSFELVYGPRQTIELPGLQPGWNLVSIPLLSLQSLDDTFGDSISGPVWGWNGEQFESTAGEMPLNPERAYWINSEGGGNANPLNGLPTDGLIRLNRTWNFVGSVGDQVNRPENAISVWEWNAATSTFQELVDTPLVRFKGYWIFSKTQSTIQLGN